MHAGQQAPEIGVHLTSKFVIVRTTPARLAKRAGPGAGCLEMTLAHPGRRLIWAQIISDRMEDKVFSWFSTKQAKAFGLELASIVVEHVPNSASMADKKGQSKINYAKEKMQKRIRQFKQEEVLNFFKTAKLLNEFKWALKDAGYSKEFADSLSSWVFIGLRTLNF